MAGAVDLKKLRKALSLGEGDDWEFKDGRGGVGKSWAETVSAFANTDGGTIVCGVESQDNDRIHVARGIKDARDYRDKIWNALRDKNVINRTCCTRGDVETVQYDGLELVVIKVPPAPRQLRPIHTGTSPYRGNTFRRFDSKDCKCDDDEVDGMLRDARGLAQDAGLVRGTSLSDVDGPTLKAYRNRVASHDPTSSLLAKDDKALLKSIGAWTDEIRPKGEGLTLAGVVMFGKRETLAKHLPNFALNYADRSAGNIRHDHRITSDDEGWGAPNLFNFFFEIYPLLVKGLQKPFSLSADAMREGRTPFHDAVREALINALIHADLHQRGTVRVVKKPDAFVFENPGRSLMPLARIKAARSEHKNLTDIRNPAVSGMFAKLGFAEREGYGCPAMYRAWDQGKRYELSMLEDPERHVVSVTLPLLSQISPEFESKLLELVGDEFPLLSSLDKDILLHACEFPDTTTKAISAITNVHSMEVSGRMRFLSNKGWLEKHGEGSKKYYTLRGKGAPLLWGEGAWGTGTWGGAPPSPSSPGGGRVTARDSTEAAILVLCDKDYLSGREIAEALKRSFKQIQGKYITPMVREGKLERKFPDNPSHQHQAYRAKK